MIQLIHYNEFLGSERLNSLLKSGSRYESLAALLSPDEQKEMLDNCIVYGSSIFDSEIFLNDVSAQS